jgi:hypothetical protein
LILMIKKKFMKLFKKVLKQKENFIVNKMLASLYN